jgi:hypothetical protein
MNSLYKSRISTGLRSGLAIAALALLGQPALACTTGAWSSDTGVTVGGPEGNPATLARYSGLCAMQAASSVHVEDASPGGISRIRARFYMLANNTSEAVVYRGLNSSDQPIFAVRVAPNGDVRLASGSSTALCATCANAGAWNSIEIDWNAGGNSLDVWVNSDATTAPADASAAFNSSQSISSVRLGNLNGASGSINFDSYESRRTTAIGRLCRGEVTGDGTRTSDDFLAIFDEVASNGGTPTAGQPDFTEDGQITNDDTLAVFELVANGQGACS